MTTRGPEPTSGDTSPGPLLAAARSTSSQSHGDAELLLLNIGAGAEPSCRKAQSARTQPGLGTGLFWGAKQPLGLRSPSSAPFGGELEQEKVPWVRRAVPAGAETAGGQTHTCKLQGFWRWKSKVGEHEGSQGLEAAAPSTSCLSPGCSLHPTAGPVTAVTELSFFRDFTGL